MIFQSPRRTATARAIISVFARNTLFSCLCLAFPALAFAAPTISSLTPTSGAVGATVTVAGTGFGATQGTSTVKFNGTVATVTAWSATSLTVKVPTGAPSGNVVVTVSGVASNGKAFTVVAVPNITSVSPTSGAVGASVTVAGSGFGTTQGVSTVKFNGVTATVTTWSATSIAVRVPAGTSGNVVVHASGVDSNGKSFTVLPTPSITSLAPTSGAVGASIVIAGTNFGSTQGTSTVKFNGTTATVTAWGATSITARVPSGATSGNVVVTVSGVASNGVPFTVVSAPAITTLSPTSGGAGTSVTITGSGFGTSQGQSTVAFNGRLGTPTSWNASTIRVPVPSGATSGNVVVHASGVDSNAKAFTVPPSPTIANLSPGSGLAGTVVTISGSNFGATKGSSTVKVNGVVATTSSWNATTVIATVPSAATTGNVVITVGGVASNGVSFVVPVLTGITVGPVDASLPIQSQQRYSATGTYSDGSSRVLTSNVTWTATAPVASIDATGLLTASAQGPATVQAAVGATSGSTTVQVTGPTFFRVGRLHTSRYAHTATRLPDGKVLIAGGQDSATNSVLSSAELYDPALGTFTPTGNMITSRRDHTATLLPNGLVLIAGGFHYLPDVESPAFAELYDPGTGMFSFAGWMVSAHFFHTATLLDNGSVLVAGGHYLTEDGGGDSPTEIYNPALGEFSQTGDLAAPRMSHAATRLADGKVLVVGGSDSNGSPLAGAEVYDPVAGVFSPGGTLGKPRQSPSATLEADGHVLVVGRSDGCTGACPSEIFDPVARTFSATASETIDRAYHVAAPLPNGKVLVIGGQEASGNTTGTAEVFDPASATFLAAGSLGIARWGHTATLLADGTVLIAGGYGAAAAEVFSPTPPVPSTLRVTPGAATMLFGQSRSFAAVDQLGAPRPDAVWSIDQAALATLDAATATLTATGAGTVTITATVQGVSASAAVTISAATSMGAGVPIWSLPPVPGATAMQVVPSSPSDSGPALYALHSSATETIVQAVADGVQLWQTWLPPTANNSVTDLSGGLVVTLDQSCNSQSPMRLAKLDAATGEPVWEFVGMLACPSDPPQIAVTPENVLAVTTAGNISGFPELMRINADTGQVLPSPAIPSSTFKDITGTVFAGYSRVGPPMVDAEGVVHLLYEVRDVDYPPRVASAQIWMMDIVPSGASTTTMLTSTTEDQNLFPGRIIPDGAGGLVAAWTVSPSHPPALQYPFVAAHVSATGTSVYALPIAPAAIQRTPSGLPINPTLVLGRDGRAFVTDTTNPADGPLVVSFNLDSGIAIWSYRATPSGKVSLLAATSNGGLAINDTAAGITLLDAAGAATPLTGPVGDDAGYSWTGEWHATGAQGLAGMSLPIDVDAANVWATAGGNASQNASAVALCPCQSQTTPPDGLFSSSAFTPRGAGAAALEPPTGSFVNLVGDPGFQGHSVGSLFDLAESTYKATATAAGNTVVTQRVSSVPDFNVGLTTHGLITGGVNFFGHAGHGSVAGKVVSSMLFVGQAAGGDTNLSELNASMLSNAQLGPNVKVTIYACRAGLRPWDKPTAPSVAQVLADRLGRSVFAWKVGLFFSETPDRRRPSETNPRGPTIYLLPFAQDRSNVKACEFKPGQPEPLHCGGVR
jgi:IPT/TIG domain/Bacterial Ig-like domain (group 2)/Galactose oxidase, central domain/Kelch motif